MTTETNQSALEKLLADSREALKGYCEYKGIQYPMDQWVTILSIARDSISQIRKPLLPGFKGALSRKRM
ncbi:hypothetical protein LZD49_02285 [Dyadobacter sp. CY261]|uniref:hypothetical protein n=1 Tax=Dyadobacter sp. CY261 TaxID=2907203 RepID=UPI001F2E6186|nr:hypothetical protein [Dyadobacter sp. CY261]MCF0069281.1 hypothetical protein [Dyadobacter sp. CY261]